MTRYEVVLRYEGDQWIARYGSLEWRASDRGQLEAQVVDYFRARYVTPFRIYMHFDMQSIPRWFHQYQTHYFNQIIEVN